MQIDIISITPFRIDTTSREYYLETFRRTFRTLYISIFYSASNEFTTIEGELRIDPELQFTIAELKNKIKEQIEYNFKSPHKE
jgi:hypothetical protein